MSNGEDKRENGFVQVTARAPARFVLLLAALFAGGGSLGWVAGGVRSDWMDRMALAECRESVYRHETDMVAAQRWAEETLQTLPESARIFARSGAPDWLLHSEARR